ncbi:unnamed protein product [Didymodactylos carnosus]|uniref:Cadmium resistance transporter n=1 Tax=Didymodactylos carnosus TaxID=1234261 RepID=A0A814W484_9BILA|nr:unnamed protein product [Didymodactylos carnosus]CAF1196949.1 unnamed protein product [Didymodactylos carnosus]CAF3775060.1 unnamed protein product [Didymodactylos carnosus]CAF3961329.1 unnamed protein product [Didymodactylos carnosus]
MTTNNDNVGKFIGTAFVAYIGTNADDLVILMNFFTEATIQKSSLKVRHVFIGQYLGFTILVAISLIGYGVSYALPIQLLGFLGFLPIILGIKGFVSLILEFYRKSTVPITDIVPSHEIQTIELETIRQRTDNGEVISEISIRSQESVASETSVPPSTKIKSTIVKFMGQFFNLQTLKIASITLANGSDNIAIYTPLFAQARKWQIGVYIAIFLVMVLVWLLFCYYFINYRPILNLAQKYAHYVVPLVFIGLGVYIIVTSNCFPWLVRAIKTKNFKNG